MFERLDKTPPPAADDPLRRLAFAVTFDPDAEPVALPDAWWRVVVDQVLANIDGTQPNPGMTYSAITKDGHVVTPTGDQLRDDLPIAARSLALAIACATAAAVESHRLIGVAAEIAALLRNPNPNDGDPDE